jgi:hypothetical protein
MTVRTEHPKIFKTMIVIDAVAVVDLDGEGLPPPL